jgi:hypothetical protein
VCRLGSDRRGIGTALSLGVKRQCLGAKRYHRFAGAGMRVLAFGVWSVVYRHGWNRERERDPLELLTTVKCRLLAGLAIVTMHADLADF